ncbi:MAG: ABC transporter ATP-binding protein [Rhodospirillales bacterium]|nr:ABC transporter ATP-binding protein [Rhodospirillales bacterium]
MTKTYRTGGRIVPALDGVDIDLAAGETLAVVGASGSGKSTLARAILRLVELDAGTIHVGGRDFRRLAGAELRAERRRIQMVFQDPALALNPRGTVRSVVADPLRVHSLVEAGGQADAVAALLDRVGLPYAFADRPVHGISGGQRQRVAIARALATKPSILVLDEPVSALDVSVRGQILNLLLDLQRKERIAYLFISHDMGVVRAVADRVVVMSRGRIVENGSADAVFRSPRSPECRELLDAVPALPGR